MCARNHSITQPPNCINLPGASIRLGLGSVVSVAPLEVVDLAVIESDQDKSAAEAAENVGASSLEESLGTLVGQNLAEAVDGSGVLAGVASRGHHHTTTDGIQRVGDEAGNDGDSVSNGELGVEVGALNEGLGSVVQSEVGSTVEDDSDAGDNESVVHTSTAPSGLLGGLHDAVEASGELAVLARADIDGEAGTGEVKRVDDDEGGGSSKTSGGKDSGKYKSSIDCGRQVLANEGMGAMYKGASANILRGLAGALVLVSFDYAKNYYLEWKYPELRGQKKEIKIQFG